MFPTREIQSLSCSYYRPVCVGPLASYVESADRTSRYIMSYFRLKLKFQFRNIKNNNMVDKRIFQTVATKALINWRNSINTMGLSIWSRGWGKFTVQMSVLGFWFPQLHSDFSSLYVQNLAIMMCSFYGKSRGLARIERFTDVVRFKEFTAENCNGKTCRHIW
jgi:hypothetical protein